MTAIEPHLSKDSVVPKPDHSEDWRLAEKRTAALLIDWAISSAIVSIPILFNISTLPHFSASFDFMRSLGHAVAKDHVVLFSFALFFTPAPLIYLRICFRIFMHSRTPGEAIMGLAVEFKNRGLARWTSEIISGFAQYWYLLLSSVLGTIAWIVSMTLLMGLFGMWLGYFGQNFVVAFMFLVWPLFVLHPLILCHFKRSRAKFPINSQSLVLDMESVQNKSNP